MKNNSVIFWVLQVGVLLLFLFNCKKEAMKVAPTVTIVAVTDIAATTATSGGEITSDGGASVTSRGVCWSANQNPTTQDTKTSNSTGTGSFTSSLTGLAPGTTYYLKAYATNAIGTAYSSQTPLTTLALAPVLTTTAVSAITSSTATSGGIISSNGGAAVNVSGVCWGTSTNPTTALSTKTTDGLLTGAFTGFITGLTPGTTYYVRAYATNSIGTGYGNEITVTTTAVMPVLTTTIPFAILATTATSGGIISSNGGAAVTVSGVCWGTSTNPTTALSTKTTDGLLTGTFTGSITGLTPGTTYYVRAYATNSAGTAYGDQITLKLLRNEANILSFEFTMDNNLFLNRNIKCFFKTKVKQIVFHNPYFDKTALVANFKISDGASITVNGVNQISGVNSNDFIHTITYTVKAENGHTEDYEVILTREIVDLEDFLRVCPMEDPNINKIMADFEIRLNGNIVTDFQCKEPYYIMSEADYTTEITYLQAMRFLYYLDYDHPVNFPGTNLRVFDWIKNKIGGINIKDGITCSYCCDIFGGKKFITVVNNKTGTSGNLNYSNRLFDGFALMNIVLILHESRHLDPFDHTSGCCTSGGQCDETLDFNNPSAFGIMVWWHKSIWEKKYKFGVDCLVQNDLFWKNNIKAMFNPNIWSNFFCSGIYTFDFPTDPFNDCEF